MRSISALLLALVVTSAEAQAQSNGPALDLAALLATKPQMCIQAEDASGCYAVLIASGITRRQATVTGFGYNAEVSAKFVFTLVGDLDGDMLCFTVPPAAELNFQVYTTGNDIAGLMPGDTLVPLNPEGRSEIAQALAGSLGRPGDRVCEQHAVHEMQRGEITALAVQSYINDDLQLDGGHIVHVYPLADDLRLLAGE